MSKSVFQPIGQKRLTNVAVVRYKKHGKRFEIACYKNKVVNWRNGVEKDLDEVLQSTAIFSNVSKGILAKKEDLIESFGTDDTEKICLLILSEGELQVSDKERKVELDALFKDVAFIISEKCINPQNGRPYPASVIERALKDAHFSADPKRAAKAQLQEALPLLQARFPIERSKMRLKVTIPMTSKDELMFLLESKKSIIEEQELIDTGSRAGGGQQQQLVVVCLVEPGMFRELHALVHGHGGGGGRLEVLSLTESDAVRAGLESLQVGGGGIGGGGAAAVGESTAAGKDDGHAIAPTPALNNGNAAPPISDTWAQHGSNNIVVAPVKSAPAAAAATAAVVFKGPVADMGDEHGSRKERFSELDRLQPGWVVELKEKGDGGVVDAVFYAPTGEKVGAFAAARRMALAHSKAL